MAYRIAPTGLGFSLTPPSWLKNAATSFIHLASGVSSAADQTQRVVSAVNTASRPAVLTAPAEPLAATDATPSWLLPVGLGLVALLVLPKVMRGR